MPIILPTVLQANVSVKDGMGRNAVLGLVHFAT